MPVSRIASESKFLGAVARPEFAASGDTEQSVADLYQRLGPILLRQAEPYVGYDAAADALNEVFAELFPTWDKLSLDQRSAEAITIAFHKRVWAKRKAESRQLSLD